MRIVRKCNYATALIFVATIISSFMFLTRPGSTQLGYAQKQGDIAFGRITAKRSLVTQLPVTRETQISRVGIRMATYARSNTCSVYFYIYKNGEVVYYHMVENASKMKDNSFYNLEDINLSCSPEDEVYLVITSPDGDSGNAVTAWMQKGGDGPQTYVYDWESGEAREYDGALMFSIYENRLILDTLYRSYPSSGRTAIFVLGIVLGLFVLLAIELLPLEEVRRKKA